MGMKYSDFPFLLHVVIFTNMSEPTHRTRTGKPLPEDAGASFSDIVSHGWIARLPEDWRPYAVLMRIDRPIGWWLLLLPGWWGMALAIETIGSASFKFWFTAFLFFVGAVVMRGAGCVMNDLWDRDLDKQVERTAGRPLASGVLSFGQGVGLLASLLFFGFTILLFMNGATIMLGIVALPLIAVYPLMKRFTWWPQAFLGITFNFGALMGWAAVANEINLPAVLLYCGGILWTLGYDTIYAHQDKEDDMMAGIKSTALYFGEKSRSWVCGFYIAAFIVIALAAMVAQGNIFTLILMIPAGFYLWIMLRSWHELNPQSSLRVFKSNRNFGFLILGAFLAGPLISHVFVDIFYFFVN